MTKPDIPFNLPFLAGKETEHLGTVLASGNLCGNGAFTKRCNRWLDERLGCRQAMLTQSCTAALEMSAILANIGPGDEVIMPSHTFVSTANAFVIRGAVPVFVDVRADTLNLDESRIEEAITPRTRAIVVVHYAGVACEMDAIVALARQHDLLVIEDAALAFLGTYRGRNLGTIGQMATLSFHESKNIVAGEGGAILINEDRFCERAEVVWEKGTNRSAFFRGQVDKYTWVDEGSSYLPSELTAAILWAQLEASAMITARRSTIWQAYHEAFRVLEQEGRVRRPVVPDHCEHNSQMYYLLLPDLDSRTRFIATMAGRGIQVLFHYVPLHDAPAGQRFGRSIGTLPITRDASNRLVRLPLYPGLMPRLGEVIDAVIETLHRVA